MPLASGIHMYLFIANARVTFSCNVLCFCCVCRVDVRRRLTVTWAREWQSNVQRSCWSKFRRPNKQMVRYVYILYNENFIDQ